MRSYPVKENPINSAVSEILRYRHTNTQTSRYFSIRIRGVLSFITFWYKKISDQTNQQKKCVEKHSCDFYCNEHHRKHFLKKYSMKHVLKELCLIQVASEMLANSTERTVTVSGSSDCVTQCIFQICAIMVEVRHLI